MQTRRMRRLPRLARPLLSIALVAGLAGAPRPASAVVVERVVAIIGDKPILLSELRTKARPWMLEIQKKVPAGAQRAAAESETYKQLIEKMIDEELEGQAAEKAHITVSSEEIDNALKNSAAVQGTTVAALYKEAKSKGLSDQDFRDEIRRQVLEGKLLLLRVKGRVRITDEDVKSMFERTVREERRRREYHPAWIILQIIPGSSPQAIEERRTLARQLAARARRGEDFAELARKYSDDGISREQGGDLGVRAPAATVAAQQGKKPIMAAQLEQAVMTLEPDEVTEPIDVAGGAQGDAIVVIKLLSRQPSRYTTLDAAKNEMLQRLQVEILEKAKRKWLDELKRRTHLDVRL